jgi:hypothetical protein
MSYCSDKIFNTRMFYDLTYIYLFKCIYGHYLSLSQNSNLIFSSYRINFQARNRIQASIILYKNCLLL